MENGASNPASKPTSSGAGIEVVDLSSSIEASDKVVKVHFDIERMKVRKKHLHVRHAALCAEIKEVCGNEGVHLFLDMLIDLHIDTNLESIPKEILQHKGMYRSLIIHLLRTGIVNGFFDTVSSEHVGLIADITAVLLDPAMDDERMARMIEKLAQSFTGVNMQYVEFVLMMRMYAEVHKLPKAVLLARIYADARLKYTDAKMVAGLMANKIRRNAFKDPTKGGDDDSLWDY